MRILNIMMLSFFSLLSTTTEAKIIKNTIACPSIEMVHQLAPLLNKAYTTGYSTYEVRLADDQKNELAWLVMSYNIAADSEAAAVELAQKRCTQVTGMVYQNARKEAPHDDKYSCIYYDGTLPNPFVSIIAISKGNP